MGGTSDAELQRVLEEQELIEAGERLLERLEAEKLRAVVSRPPVQAPIPDFAI